MTKKQKENAAIAARETLLKEYITPETTLGIVITHVSKSGMSRRMRVLVGASHHEITYLIGQLCDLSVNEKGLKIDGCGMDMTFWLADNITWRLWGKEKPAGLEGNGGGCLPWKAIY